MINKNEHSEFSIISLSLEHIKCNLASGWAEIAGAFSGIAPISFEQTWQDEKNAQPAWVKMAIREKKLLVYAEFTDYDISNPATRFNDPVRNKGDFLELILKPEGQSSYYELHVTPQNLTSSSGFLTPTPPVSSLTGSRRCR